MKIALLYLCLIFISIKSNAQDHQKKLDYQYSRIEAQYFGYTLSVDTLAKNAIIDFVVNEQAKKIARLLLITGHGEIELKFLDNRIQVSNDDEELRSFNLKVDFPTHLQSKENCQNVIRFVISKKRYFELPINLCLLKGYL